uniref:Basal body-orientation factor 1 n=1 Tax=Tetraodon nigroviridis TaxID=99883 RepID=H3DJ33_TETNG
HPAGRSHRKGKKDGKEESKPDKESDMEKVKANAALWEFKLQVSDRALLQYREECHKLARAHGELTDQLYRQERDAIDITRYLKEQNTTKEKKIDELQNSLQTQEVRAREEQSKLVEDYTLQINELHKLFRQRSGDFDKIQDGLKQMEEFERSKAQMEQELGDIRNAMAAAEKEHRENLNAVEFRFFKEKARLEREAEEQIALVVETAHSEAVLQLDDASRSVFKENIRLNEALKYHMKETEDLQKLTASLAKRNASLTLDKNMLELAVKDNTAQMEAQREKLAELRAKVASLEQSLELTTQEKEQQERKEKTALVCTPDPQVDLENLQKELARREKELAHIKGVARTVVEQRTELERFFHDALAQVKREITASRQRYTKEALHAYRCSFREATAGKLQFPPICTFHKSPQSTNSVYSNAAAVAERCFCLP